MTTPTRPVRNNENKTPGAAPWSLGSKSRFGGHGSYLQKPCGASPTDPKLGPKAGTPRKGVAPLKPHPPQPTERYATPAERALDRTPNKREAAAYASGTDRFGPATPGSVYPAADGPGVGAYTPADQAARVQGAVKLQKAARRRQSSLSHQKAEIAKNTPAPGAYESAPGTDIGAGPISSLVPGAVSSFHSGSSRFAGQASIYPDEKSGSATPGVGSYTNLEMQAIAKARVCGAVALQKAVRHRQSRGIFGQKKDVTPGPGDYAPSMGWGKEPKPEPKPHAARASRLKFELKARPLQHAAAPAAPAAPAAAEPLSAAALSIPSSYMPGPTTLDARLSNMSEIVSELAPPKPERYSEGGTALGSYDQFASSGYDKALGIGDRLSAGGDRFSMGGTATGAYDSFNPAAIGAALESTLDALEEEGEGNEAGVAETVEGDAMGHERATKRYEDDGEWSPKEPSVASEDGEWLFSQLSRICPEGAVSKEDYYAEKDGWDLAGLRSDLELYMGSKAL